MDPVKHCVLFALKPAMAKGISATGEMGKIRILRLPSCTLVGILKKYHKIISINDKSQETPPLFYQN